MDQAADKWGGYPVYEIEPALVPQSASPVAVPGDVGPFVAIAAGRAHACGLLANGSAYCWGSNLNGALGIGNDTVEQSAEPVPVYVPGNETFVQLSSWEFTTCGVLSNQTAVCW